MPPARRATPGKPTPAPSRLSRGISPPVAPRPPLHELVQHLGHARGEPVARREPLLGAREELFLPLGQVVGEAFAGSRGIGKLPDVVLLRATQATRHRPAPSPLRRRRGRQVTMLARLLPHALPRFQAVLA